MSRPRFGRRSNTGRPSSSSLTRRASRVVAAAGGVCPASRISALIPIDTCVPAPGQGIIGVEIRSDDDDTRQQVSALNDQAARIALQAEQSVVAALGGGCQLPLGAYASMNDGTLVLRAVVASPDGDEILSTSMSGNPVDAAAIGRRAADDLSAQGARRILQT